MSQARRIEASTTIEDLASNPNAYGIPTFEQYQSNRAKWNPSAGAEDAMVALTDGPRKFRKDLDTIKFQVHGKTMPEEQIERALSDFGFTLADIDLENRNSTLKKQIEMLPQGGGRYELVVNFLP